jgi:translation initiation factor 4B
MPRRIFCLLTLVSGDRTSSGYGARREFGSPSSASGNDRYSGYSRGSSLSESLLNSRLITYLADRDFPTRDQLPIPDKPPYTAHIGNLSFDATEGEISDFFGSCEVTNVRLVRDRETDRPKGFGYVEFGSKEGLIKALDLNSSQLAGRNVRISVAEPRKFCCLSSNDVG